MTIAASGKGVSAELHTDVCQFLYREARALDDNRFEDWLEMLTEDVEYEMPLTLTRERAEQERVYEPRMQYFAENIHSLRMRVARLRTEYAWAEDPPSRTRHLVSNVELDAAGDGSEVAVQCAFVVYMNRGADPSWDMLVGHRQDLLVRDGADWKIRRRRLYLDQAVLSCNSISIFL